MGDENPIIIAYALMGEGITAYSLRITGLESYIRFRGSLVILCKLPVPIQAM